MFWEESNAYRMASAKIILDTGLNLIFDVGISDFETALDPNAEEYDKGLACGRIVGAILSITSFLAATRIAAELKSKMGSFSANMWSAVGSLKAYLTFALYDLVESLIKGRRMIRWLAENPREALTFAKLTILGALEKLRERTLDVWEKVKARIKSAVDEAESKARDEDYYKNIEEAVRGLEDVAELNGKMVDVAEKTEQGKACELFYKLDETGLSVKERKRILEELEAIAGKSREAGSSVVEWLLAIGSGRLREILDSDILGKISELEESVLRDVGRAWRLNEDIGDFDSLMKGVETALELRSEERRDRIFKLLNDFVGTGDRDKVSFSEKALGWMYRIRKSFEGGENERTNVVDWVVELAGLLYSKDVGGDDMMHVSKVMNVLADVYGDKNAYYVFPELKQQLYEDVGLKPRDPEKRSFNLNLLRDCLRKWEIALTIKDEELHVAFQRLSDSRHQASTPMEVNYVKVGATYIPVIATPVKGRPDYIVAIPMDAAEYFKRIGYLPGEEGSLLFVEDVPENAKIITPAVVGKGGKIALMKWLERFLHKNPWGQMNGL